MNKRQFLLLICLILPSVSNAQETPAINRLTMLGMGAKATAFNGAFTAVADDYSATFWNPAAVCYINGLRLGCMHSQMSLKRTMDFVSLIVPLPAKNFLGISWTGFKVTDIEARSGNSQQPDYVFDSNERMLWLTYSKKLFPLLSYGLNVKILQSQITYAEALGWGIDLGMMFNPFKDLKLCVVYYDIFSSLNWNSGYVEKLKEISRFGFSYIILKKVLFSVDLMNVDNKITSSLGTEIQLFDVLKLRTGLRHSDLAIGTGLNLYFVNGSILSTNYSIRTDPLNVGLYHIVDVNIQLL